VLGKLRVERWVSEGQTLGEFYVPGNERATAEVERHIDECLIKRERTACETTNPRLVAEGLTKCFTQRDRNILDGVVRVDVEITLCLDVQAESAVLSQLIEHVIEERNPGGHVRGSRAVEVDEHIDRRFLGGAGASGGSGHGF